MGNTILDFSDLKLPEDTVFSPEDNNYRKPDEVYLDIDILATDKTGSNPRGQDIQDDMWISKGVNVQAVFNSIRNIFWWIPGQRVLLPEFGQKLREYLYEGITTRNVEQIISEIKNLCLKWEPRANIISVRDASSIEDTENNTVRLDIIFTIPSLSDEQYTYSYIYNRAE